uniref:Uncharacterized protein n=1 Tax=Mola mola TaxID=94237 RepID=A0A3Q3WU97_MOLML
MYFLIKILAHWAPQKVICKGDEAILKNNSQRSKWDITGPGGLDMTVPSVCLIIPPPNPLSVSLANKNDQYYEAILSIWNQLYINVKSLIAWQYCLRDIRYINSLTISMISKMRPEEYRHIIKNLENHFAEFKSSCKGSEMFVEEDKEIIENQFNGAQAHYDQLVVELPTYMTKAEQPKKKVVVSTSLSELHALRLRLEGAESMLSQHVHIYFGDDGVYLIGAHSVARAEDIVKVHEAILTEKETTSLSLNEVENYILTLTLDQRKDVLTSMESELAKVSHWNGQVGGPFHRCDMILSKYTEHVGLLGDRWRRIDGQIDNRLQDLQSYHPQLQHYKQTTASLIDWIEATRKKQNDYFTGVFRYIFIIFVIKVLNSEIKLKREMVESVLKDNAACMNTIKDYETDLTVYASGLETLLNIPIKRTMLKSPSMELHQEAIEVQTCYMELLTMSGDYYRYLGELLKNMEELKIRDTKIDLLEEELRLLKENFQDSNTKNKSLEDDLARYKLELFQSRDQLLSMEEVKQSTVLQCNATKESLDNTQSQLVDLNDQVTRLNYLLEEEKRKKRLAEERYLQQQEEYDSVLRKRQNELETVSWSKMEVEKSLESKEYEIEQLRRQLAENAERIKELQKEMLKVRSKCNMEITNLKLGYESQIHISHADIQRLAAQRVEDAAEFQMQHDRIVAERRSLEEELRRLRIYNSEADEQRNRAEGEAHSQRVLITKEGCRRRELENEVEVLMRQREEEGSRYKEELAEVTKMLQEKREKLAYITHSLQEEIRRRKTVEEGQDVLEKTLAQLQLKLTSSSMAAEECKDELQKRCLELDRESRDRSRVDQNISRLQGRMKDLQAIRNGLESQVENLSKAKQDEVARRRQVETELEKTKLVVKEYTSTITSEKCMMQLSAELKTLKQQLLQEQARVKEVNLSNDSLLRTIEETSKALSESNVEIQRLEQLSETQTKERLGLEEELRAAQHDNQELLRSKQGCHELSAHITALELQLQGTKRSNIDYRYLVSELSSETEKLKLETEKTQNQVTETTAMLQSLQSQHNEIVSERDTLMMKLQLSEKDKERFHRLEDEFSHIKLSLESELCSKQRLTEENERVNRDLDYWKDQYDSKQGLIRQYETDKERLERENNSLKSEIERLMVELRELGETYKSRLAAIQKELQEVILVRQHLEAEVSKAREPPTLDASTVIFDGVRKPVTANQLLDCGVLDKPTFSQLINGHKTVPDVSVDKKVSLKGTGPIAGVTIEGQKSPGSISGPLYKMTFNEVKKENLLPPDSIDLLLDAQAATGYIIDPRTNQKLTVEEACNQGVVDEEDKERLLAAEAAAVGYRKMSFTEAKKQKVMSSDSADMLLDAQAATGHIIDPRTNKKLTVKEACATGVVDIEDESKLLAAEAAAIGYKDPITAKLLSAGQAMKMGLINKDTALRILQAQQSAGGILDPVLSVFLPKDIAMDRGLINEDLYQELNQHPECYLDPDTQQPITYISLKTKCKVDRSTGLLLLPEPQNITVDGLRGKVSVIDLVDANLLEYSDIDELREGRLTSYEIESRLSLYLRGSTCIAGVYDEANDKIVPLYQAMKDGLLQPDMTLKLLEAQAASGFIVDPVNNLYLTVGDAYNKKLFGPEFKENLLAAERAVTGYKLPGTDKTISLFQAIERGLTDKDHGSRLLEAQIASGGIIDPKHGHRIGMNVAYKRGYLNEKMNNIVTDQGVASKSYFDPNTEENLTYMELKERCITDEKNGLLLLPIMDEKKKESTMENTLRRRRVVIVDPETNKEMTVREAYDKGYIDYDTFMELSEQECEWEEVTITEPDGSTRFIINDRTTGKQYDITELLEKQVINQSDLDQYRSRTINITQFAGIITNKTNHRSLPASDMSVPLSLTSSSSSFLSIPLSPTLTTMTTTKNNTVSEQNSTISTVSQDSTEYHRNISRVSITLASPAEILVEQEPVGAIFDTETLEKISITEALNRGLVDSITAQRLLEAQACTGGIINPINGQRLSIQEAARLGVINEVMASRLKPSQKAYFGFEDVKTRKKMSTAEAMKEMWLPYEAGQRFMEFQYVTGGLYDPQIGCRRSIQDALEMGWLDENTAHKLQDINHHVKNLTCPKTKLKISYKEALDSCMVEERTGVKMLQASSVSSKGISSPYNVSGPGSTTGSRSGSRRSSRRGSVDLSSPRSSSASSLSPSSFITFCSTATK